MTRRKNIVAAACIALVMCAFVLTTGAGADIDSVSVGATPASCCCEPGPEDSDAVSCGCCGTDGESAPGEPCPPGTPCECSDGGGGLPPMAPAPVDESPIARKPDPTAPRARVVWPALPSWRSMVEEVAATGPPVRLRTCVWLI